MSRRRWSSFGGGSSASGKVVVVAVKPARDKISTTALLWAFSNVVQPGDSVNLLLILPDLHSLGEKIRAFTRFRGECSSGHRKFDQRDEISDLCSQMMNQLRNAYDIDKLRFRVKVISESTTGSVAAEAKNNNSNWVILDKYLKHEKKCCMEKLDCNLVIMKKKSRPKVLRLNLNGSSFKLHEPQVSFPWPLGVDDDGPPPATYFDCRDDNNSTLRAPSVTPTSTPDHEIFSLTITDLGSSISSSEPGASPFIANIRKNSLFIADESDSGLDHESEFPSFNSTSKSVREAISLPRNVPLHGSPALCTVCQHKAPGFGNPPKWFTYEELEAATNGFSKENFLAEGGFGSVYRGELPDGQVVAVKQHKSVSSQGDVEFCSEVEVLSCAQHRNVVMLIGFCIENARRLLVYEYVCNGSLDSHLFGLDRDALTWHARQRIAVGAARGLRYLHEECRVGCIVHRDMRPNNILLTHDFEPLVGDFGLARWQPHADLGVSTRIIGTFGYLAPEYVQSGQITEKADVYAFGVVLLELITGRKAIDVQKPKGQQCLTEWARPLLEKNRVDELVDPRVSKRYLVVQQLSNMMFCASLCLKRDPDSRPRMSQVLRILEGDLLMNSPTGNQTT